MAYTTPEDVYNRFTGDEYVLPPASKLTVLIEDAEDILFQAIEGLEERAQENEQVERRIQRVVSGAVIRYANTAAEGIGSHQMTIGGASEMVTYSGSRNKNTIFFTSEELDSLRGKADKPRLTLVNLYGGYRQGNPVIGWKGMTAIYGTEFPHNHRLNDYYS